MEPASPAPSLPAATGAKPSSSFLSSDAAYEHLQLAKHFVLAYALSLAPFLFLSFLLLLFAWDTLYMHTLWHHSLLSLSPLVPLFIVLLIKLQPPARYLIDFSCFKSLDQYKLSPEINEYMTNACGKYTLKTLLFQLKVFMRSGIGDETYGPPFIYSEDRATTQAAAHEEMDQVMFGALEELLSKTFLSPTDIDVLIVNVSTFAPTPSLCSRLMNRFKMREDVKSFNLSGMGCASGMVAVDLAKDMLKVHKRKNVVVVGSENITLNWYFGNDKSMQLPNCLFRCGAYALLLSNKREDKVRAKFELVQSVRTTTAASDMSYNCIVNREDDEGIVGISLSANLLDVASHALALSMTKLLPYNMPLSELLKVVKNAVQRVVFKSDVKPYLPDFKKAFTHFCIHPGGRAVVEGIGKNLRLGPYDIEPSKMALHRFGNTSSSGLWYVLAYCEVKERLKKGDKVWQVAFGSGFKCNSVVWRVLRDVKAVKGYNPWLDCIHRYPVDVPNTITPSHRYYDKLKFLEDQVKQEEARCKQQAI